MTDIGTIVTYKLTADDADQINRRRDDYERSSHSPTVQWPYGAQAHRGNRAYEAQVFPAVVVRDWGGLVNLKVFLDGNDDLWVMSKAQGHSAGEWLPANELR